MQFKQSTYNKTESNCKKAVHVVDVYCCSLKAVKSYDECIGFLSGLGAPCNTNSEVMLVVKLNRQVDSQLII